MAQIDASREALLAREPHERRARCGVWPRLSVVLGTLALAFLAGVRIHGTSATDLSSDDGPAFLYTPRRVPFDLCLPNTTTMTVRSCA